MNDRPAALSVIFLDRDGVLNVDFGFVHRVEDWCFTPRAPEALRRLQTAGYTLAVVTNQGAIARGAYTEEDVRRLHAHAAALLAAEGVSIAAWAYCPHDADDGCACRKPSPGMLASVRSQLPGPIDLARGWMIGDKPSDVGFGRAIGVRTALLRGRYWKAETLAEAPTVICDSLWEAAETIVAQA